MSTQSVIASNTTAKVSWMTLLGLSVLATLNHLILIFVIASETTLFIGWAAYNTYASIVLFIPFRRGERWAWYTTWILVIGFASMILFDTQVGLGYAIAAGIMAVCLFLTRGAFFSKG
jgi:hypothetical protein